VEINNTSGALYQAQQGTCDLHHDILLQQKIRSLSTNLSHGSQVRFRCVNPPGALPPVDKKSGARLTDPVNRGVLFKVNCSAQNPSAAMRDGFCCEEPAVFSTIPGSATASAEASAKAEAIQKASKTGLPRRKRSSQ
jgi:hypothetical protein